MSQAKQSWMVQLAQALGIKGTFAHGLGRVLIGKGHLGCTHKLADINTEY